MAVAKTARVVATTEVGPETRLLEIALPAGEPLGFIGGQYIIVNSNVALPGGKVAKRAYSILSSDAEQQRITLAVRRIGAGSGSNFMHRLKLGDEVPFSGPWGQFVPGPDDRVGTTLVIATDTGITAALGLVRAQRFQPRLASCHLIWLLPANYFVSEAFVHDLLPKGLGGLQVEPAPAAGEPGRTELACRIANDAAARFSPQSVYLSGDGSVLVPIQEQLRARGYSGSVQMETFFNHVVRKAPA